MSDRGAGATEAVVPFAPKPNAKPEAGDPLDRAGQAILGLLHRAAADAEANYQQALEMTRQRSAQLRAAEDQIRDLRPMPGTIRTGQSGLNGGCIKSLLRSSRSSLGGPKLVPRNHLLQRR